MDRGWIGDGTATHPPPSPPHEKKIAQGWPQKEDYGWSRWGWTSEHVSRDVSAMIALISL